MPTPSGWFPKRLDGAGFTLFLVHPDLEIEIPFVLFEQFREEIWADGQRACDAGFILELNREPDMNWDRVQPDRDDDAGRYVVVSPDQRIVGLLKVRRVAKDNTAVYANVLYRRREDRRGISPDAVLGRVLDWLRQSGIEEVTTGYVTESSFDRHVKRCGFTRVAGVWRIRLCEMKKRSPSTDA